MEKVKGQLNKKRLSIVMLYIIILAASLIILPVSLIARGGTVDSAIALKSEWAGIESSYTQNKLVTDSMETIYNDFLSDKSGNTLLKYTSTGTGKSGVYNYAITINTPRDLMMFSYAAFGSHYGGGDSLTKLQEFVLKANFIVTQNIDYTASAKERVIYAYGDPTITDKLYSARQTKTHYYTNALYEGYAKQVAGQPAPLVPKMFVPVSNFEGVFNGQNFMISNLKISSSEITSAKTSDAMFESILAPGYVHSFGLFEPEIIGNSAAKKNASLVVSSNAGTLEYVYALGAKVTNTLSSAFSVISNNTGTAIGYYSAKTSLDGAQMNDFKMSYASESALKADARWHYDHSTTTNTVGTSVLPEIFKRKFANDSSASVFANNTFPNLFGLRRAYDSSTLISSVRTVADFLLISQTILENNNTLNIRIENDLDFSFVNEYAFIPAVSIATASNPNIQIFSGALNSIGTSFSSNVKINNFKIHAFLSSAIYRDSVFSSQTFYSSMFAGNPILSAYNLNFLGGSILAGEIPETGIVKNANINAGLFVANSSSKLSISNVGSNNAVNLATGTYVGAEVAMGGLVGKSLDVYYSPEIKITRVAVTADVIAGDNNLYSSINAQYSVGGVFGFSNSTNQLHDTVYSGGKIRGMRLLKKKEGESNFYTNVGGYIGKGSLYAKAISGIYCDSTVTNFDNTDAVSDIAAENTHSVGGIIGFNDSPDVKTNSNGFITNGSSLRFNGTINVSQKFGDYDKRTNVRIFVGGIAGSLADGMYNFAFSDVLGDKVAFNLNYSALSEKAYTYVGALAGDLKPTAFIGKDNFSVTVDRAYSYVAPGGNISVGGLFGLGDIAASVKNVITTTASYVTLTVSGGNGLCKVNGIGEIANFSNIVFHGKVKGEFNGANGSIYVSGIGYNGNYSDNTIASDANISAVSVDNTNDIFLSGMMSILSGGGKSVIKSCINNADIVIPDKGNNVYVAGLAGRALSVESSNNTGNISGTTSAKILYVSGLAHMGAGDSSTDKHFMKNCRNDGAITITAASTDTYFQIGGVILSGGGAEAFDKLTNTGTITFNGTTSGDKGTARLLIGGVVASEEGVLHLTNAFNSGNIIVNNYVNSYITSNTSANATIATIGGIVGGSNMLGFALASGINGNETFKNLTNVGNITVKGMKNTAIAKSSQNINTRFVNVGGILGIGNPQGATFDFRDCVNYGNISSFGRSGGIIGTYVQTNGSATYSNFKGFLNYGDVKGETAGGIIASADTPRYSLIGALNYGNINTASDSLASAFVGGIMGVATARNNSTNYETAVLTDAVNYGNIGKVSGTVLLENGSTSNAVSGGIVGAVINYNMGAGGAVFKSLRNIIHFDGLLTSSNPTLFGNWGVNNVSTLSPDLANIICVSDVSVTSNTGVTYYANTALGAVLGKKWIYADDFIWGLGNEIQDMATLKDKGAMFVWSELPKKTGGKYHSDKITDVNRFCFALTTTDGRVHGRYLGDTDTYFVGGAAYDYLKQIDYSRDLFAPGFNGVPPIMRDSAKTADGEIYSDIGTSAYSEKELETGANRVRSGSFMTVFDKAFPYYINNSAKGTFTLDGRDVDLKPSVDGASEYYGLFSNNVSAPSWASVDPSFTDIFDSSDSNVYKKIMEKKITVYQGATLKTSADFLTEAEYARYKRLYTRDYTFKVIFYNQDKSLELVTSADKLPTLISPDASGTADVTTILDGTADNVNGNLKEYAFEKTNGANDVTVNWEKGIFTANFLAQGFDISVLTAKDTITLMNGSTTIPQLAEGTQGGYSVEFSYTIVSEETFEFEGVTITVNVYEVTVKVTLTDKAMLNEISGGSYRLTYKVNTEKGALERVFTFAKEQSGDVFLRYNASGETHDGKLATGKNPANANVYVSQFLYHYGSDNRVKTSIKRTTVGYNYTIEDSRATVTKDGVTSSVITFKPLTLTLNDSDALVNNRSTAFPDFFTAGKSVLESPLNLFDNLRGFNGNSFNTEHVTLSKPSISVLTPKDSLGEYTGAISYLYSFSVFAPNGNEGKYSIKFTNSLANTGTTTLSEGFLTNGIGVVGRGEIKNFTLKTSFTSETPIILDYSMPKVEIWAASERVGTVLKNEKLIAIYNYNTTPELTDDFEVFDPSYILPEVTVLSTAEKGIEVKFTFQGKTSGGIYKLRPMAKYSYDIALPSELNFTVSDGVNPSAKVSTFVFPTFNYHTLLIEKTASTKRHISDMDFSTPPDSGSIQYYVSNTPISVDGAFAVDGLTGKAKVSHALFPSGVDMNRLRMVVKYAAADADLDYNTDIVFELYGEGYYTGATAATDYATSFIDEYARIFLVTDKGISTELRKETIYTDSTNTVVKMVRYFMFLPESQAFNLRVVAENPAFYCDYQLLSDGTPRNKTFNVEVSSPLNQYGLFTVSLKTQIAGVFTRSTNLLYVVTDTPSSSHYYAKKNVDNTGYFNNYISTLNMSATYVLSVSSPENNVKIVIDEILVLDGGSSSRLTVNLSNNSFTITGDDPLSLRIKISLKIDEAYIPPWGATGKG